MKLPVLTRLLVAIQRVNHQMEDLFLSAFQINK